MTGKQIDSCRCYLSPRSPPCKCPGQGRRFGRRYRPLIRLFDLSSHQEVYAAPPTGRKNYWDRPGGSYILLITRLHRLHAHTKYLLTRSKQTCATRYATAGFLCRPQQPSNCLKRTPGSRGGLVKALAPPHSKAHFAGLPSLQAKTTMLKGVVMQRRYYCAFINRG